MDGVDGVLDFPLEHHVVKFVPVLTADGFGDVLIVGIVSILVEGSFKRYGKFLIAFQQQ